MMITQNKKKNSTTLLDQIIISPGTMCTDFGAKCNVTNDRLVTIPML